MTKIRGGSKAAALAALLLAAVAAASQASVFFPWRIAGVGPGDLLNIRAYPSSGSRVLVGYPNGTVLSLTGRCTKGIDLDSITSLSKARQYQRVRTSWCEAWLDPDGGGGRIGWVYGRYIRPF